MSYSGGMPVLVVPLHMGALHPMESLVMAALALGPFVILAVVVTVVSRRDRRTEPQRAGSERPGSARSGPAGSGRPADGQAARVDPEWPDAAGSATTETAAPQSVQQ
jgi:hypothetical protein